MMRRINGAPVDHSLRATPQIGRVAHSRLAIPEATKERLRSDLRGRYWPGGSVGP